MLHIATMKGTDFCKCSNAAVKTLQVVRNMWHNAILQHPVAHHFLEKSLSQLSCMQHFSYKIFKICSLQKYSPHHITLHVSANMVFKMVVDGNCCASIFIVSVYSISHLCACVSGSILYWYFCKQCILMF
jgi:hypothetical protein